MEESKKEISHEDGSEVTRELPSQKLRKMSPELDPLRIGTGWTPEELSKPQIFIESTFGDSHPGSGHLDRLVKKACEGAADAGGHGARYFTTKFRRMRRPSMRECTSQAATRVFRAISSA